MEQFMKDISQGNRTENIIKTRLESSSGGAWQVVKVPPKTLPYDLIGKRRCPANKGRSYAYAYASFEVKGFECPGGEAYAFFETESLKTGLAPEYLRHSDQVDFVIRYNKTDGRAYVIDNRILSHCLKTVKYHHVTNAMSTARGVVLLASCPQIGFIGELLAPPH